MTEQFNPKDEFLPSGPAYFPHILFLCIFPFSNLVLGTILAEFGSAFIGTFLMGGFVAQFGLLVTWSVFGRIPAWKRMLCSMAVGTLLWESIILGGIAHVDPASLRVKELLESQQLLLIIPLLFASALPPCWMVKVIFGWELSNDCDLSGNSPLGIRHLMFATAAIALMISMARWYLTDNKADSWANLGGTCATTLASSMLLLVPVVWATLKSKKPLLSAVATVCFSSIYYATLSLLLWVNLRGPFFGYNLYPFFIIVLPFVVGLTSVLVAGLVTARSCGYRLVGRAERVAMLLDSQTKTARDFVGRDDDSSRKKTSYNPSRDSHRQT